MPRPPVARPMTQGRGGRGGGGGVPGTDTAPTGNVGGDLGKAIANTMLTNQQNAAANQLLNQGPTGQPGGGVTQSLGQLPSGDQGAPQDFTLPDTSGGGLGPNVGSLVHTGGVNELNMRMAMAQQQQAQAKQDLADQLTKARIASEIGRSGLIQAQTERAQRPAVTKPTKPGSYQPWSIDANNDPAADNYSYISADFDNKYGAKGAYGAFSRAYNQLTPDDLAGKTENPAMTINRDKDGNVTSYTANDAKSNPVATVPASEAPYWMDRTNAANIRLGQPRIGPMPNGVNDNSGQPGGSSQVNPIAVTSNLQARALPTGTWIQLPDGSTRQIQRGAQQPQAQQPIAQQQTDTGNGSAATVGDQTDQTDQSDEEQ